MSGQKEAENQDIITQNIDTLDQLYRLASVYVAIIYVAIL